MIGALSCLSGCNRYRPWLEKHFSGASLCDVRELVDAQSAIRRVPVYEPYAWKTVDILYAIPLNELVVSVQNQLNCCGVSPIVDVKKENGEPRTRFYVLMNGDKADWCFVLIVSGDKMYKSSSVKARALDRGMKGILVDQLEYKKNIFEVCFDAVVGDNACDLIASNGTYQVTLSWESFEMKKGLGKEGTMANPQRMDTFF